MKIKHTLIIDEGPFSSDILKKDSIKGLSQMIPSRSPSPLRLTNGIKPIEEIDSDIDIE